MKFQESQENRYSVEQLRQGYDFAMNDFDISERDWERLAEAREHLNANKCSAEDTALLSTWAEKAIEAQAMIRVLKEKLPQIPEDRWKSFDLSDDDYDKLREAERKLNDGVAVLRDLNLLSAWVEKVMKEKENI